MKIGHLIRAERVRQDMKQIVLAKGICTPSYLSKIERNQIEPSEDIMLLLMARLDMDPGKLQKTDEQTELEFEKMLMGIYKLVITSRTDKLTKEKLDYLEKNSPLFENNSLHYTYSLIILRFRLILRIDLVETKKDIDALSHSVEQFNSYQMYLFKLNLAIYAYSARNRKESIAYFEDILDNLDKFSLSEWEKAEIYYMIAVIYVAEGHISTSADYIRYALNFFRENLMMSRVLDCYILIGITRKRSEQFQESLDAYSKAMQICDEFNLNNEKGIIYHNIGTLNSAMNNSSQALLYYQKSIDNKKDEDDKLISIFCLIVEHSKRSDKLLVIEWANRGIDLYHRLNDENQLSYFHHFNLYKSLHSENGYFDEIAKETIQHFKDIQDFRYIHKYCIALAEWYYNNRKYKLSSIYYREANRYGYIYRKVEKWEDL
ncbi:transcriptional regulator [Sporosarcina luteola]|uniref:Transcriptional regulator n=1 Tax=Sporosarcina luteola TaxID=582850 RepID=A0A511Z4R7_9BACL|nr:tetratricopeptide repeat protein [Sporosarcina luteola]GEN82443.1 transcriptional regulator [Sporosarcina luteola]